MPELFRVPPLKPAVSQVESGVSFSWKPKLHHEHGEIDWKVEGMPLGASSLYQRGEDGSSSDRIVFHHFPPEALEREKPVINLFHGSAGSPRENDVYFGPLLKRMVESQNSGGLWSGANVLMPIAPAYFADSIFALRGHDKKQAFHIGSMENLAAFDAAYKKGILENLSPKRVINIHHSISAAAAVRGMVEYGSLGNHVQTYPEVTVLVAPAAGDTIKPLVKGIIPSVVAAKSLHPTIHAAIKLNASRRARSGETSWGVKSAKSPLGISLENWQAIYDENLEKTFAQLTEEQKNSLLVIGLEKDKLVDTNKLRKLCQSVGIQYRSVKARHDFLRDEPEEAMEVIEKFVHPI